MIDTQARYQRILDAHADVIASAADLTGDAPPSALFLLMGMKYRALFDTVSDETARRQLAWRRPLHPIIHALLPLFMTQRHIIENREALRTGTEMRKPDPGITLPSEPVIWMANHRFKDDAAATLHAMYRHAYMLFGSVPQFYNTFDGLASYLNGVILINRKLKTSTGTSVARAVQAMRQGVDLMIMPEGVWNKTPNELVLPLWSGIYRISQETGAKVVPVVHYVRDPAHKLPGNDIHTVVDDPVSLEGMSEQAALAYLRDIMATWVYRMMERYGKATREEALGGGDFVSAWEQQLVERVRTADRYDTEIEFAADCRPKSIVRPEDVWRSIAEVRTVTPQNISHVLYAKAFVEQRRQEDFQRRF